MEETKNENQTERQAINQQPSMISEPDKDGVRYYNISSGKKRRASGENDYSGSDGGSGGDSNHRLRNSLIIFGGIIVALIIIGVSCNSFADRITSSVFGIGTGAVVDENALPTDPYIAELHVEGTISSATTTTYLGEVVGYNHQWTLDKIDELMYDDYCKGIIFFVDTPGGGVYESDELYFKIKEYQDYTGNPVYSAMGSMAASGGYYISAPCDKIIANRNCWTGSIGVTMGTLYDFSGLLEKYGVKTHTITSGANKAMGSSVDPLTPEQQAIFQSLIDEAYDQFVGVVAEGRDMDESVVRPIADGRIYTAKQAMELGLIDEIGTLDEAIADMQATYELEHCEVIDLEYQHSSVWSSLFSALSGIRNPGGDVEALVALAEDGNEYPISYMCEALK